MNRLNNIERPNIADWSHTETVNSNRHEYYRMIIGSWYLISGIEPFEEFCKEQVTKLIGLYPADKEIIMEVYGEVWGE